MPTIPQSIAPTSEQISRPLGRLPNTESSGAKWPLTNTSWQAAPATRNHFNLPRGNCNGALHCALERNLCHRSKIGKPPIFVVRGRETFSIEARPGVLTELPQPHRVAFLPLRDQFAIRFEICIRSCCHLRHLFLASADYFFPVSAVSQCAHHACKVAATLASAELYPVSSSSRASSGPPERTIFPSTSTCTKSVAM